MNREYCAMLATMSTRIGKREMLRTVEGEVEAVAWIDAAQIRDVEDPHVEPEVDVHEQHLEHQREPEDGYGQPNEARCGRGVVEHAVLA